ncbi:hypothetical protein TNCV_4562491 [Trichonephila clavipes]|nr:hypothetical protein TNCV_4562491 [Trichonephila clavipes]
MEGQGTRNNPAFVRKRPQYRRAGWMVWGGISIGGRTDLHIIRNGTTGRSMLEAETIQRMEWPACSPDLIEHVWDMLGRRIVARPRPPATTWRLH